MSGSTFDSPPDGHIVTFSEITSWLSCRKQHHYNYENLIIRQPTLDDHVSPRQFGSDVHEWAAMVRQGDDELPTVDSHIHDRYGELLEQVDVDNPMYSRIGKCYGLALAYMELINDDKTLENITYSATDVVFPVIEHAFEVPITSPLTGLETPTRLRYGGRIDGIVSTTGETPAPVNYLYELKTTSRLNTYNRNYFKTLTRSWQLPLYLYACREILNAGDGFPGVNINGDVDLCVVEAFSTDVHIRLKKEQSITDYVNEIYLHVLSKPESYRCVELVIPEFSIIDAQQMLYDVSKEIFMNFHPHHNSGIGNSNCSFCDYLELCPLSVALDFDLPTGFQRRTHKHQEL